MFSTNRRGQALIESIIVIPVLLIVVTTIFWFSRVVLTRQQLLAAARYGTDLMVYTTLDEEAIRSEITDFLCTSKYEGRTLDRARVDVKMKLERFPEITADNVISLLPQFATPWEHLSAVTVTYAFDVPPIIAAFSDVIPNSGFAGTVRVSGHAEVLVGTGCRKKV